MTILFPALLTKNPSHNIGSLKWLNFDDLAALLPLDALNVALSHLDRGFAKTGVHVQRLQGSRYPGRRDHVNANAARRLEGKKIAASRCGDPLVRNSEGHQSVA